MLRSRTTRSTSYPCSLPMFLQNIFVYTTFSKNNNHRFSMSQHQVLSSKTSVPSAQSTMASILLILTHLSSTCSTRNSCTRSRQCVNNIGLFFATQAPCHQSRPSTLLRRSNCNPLMPEFNFQLQMASTSRCMATKTSTSSLATSTCMFASTSAMSLSHFLVSTT